MLLPQAPLLHIGRRHAIHVFTGEGIRRDPRSSMMSAGPKTAP